MGTTVRFAGGGPPAPAKSPYREYKAMISIIACSHARQ